MSRSNFMESKIASDKEMLLQIQEQIEKKSITIENIIEITRDLSNEQKEQLKQLYIEQIEKLKLSTENHKKKILKIKSKI